VIELADELRAKVEGHLADGDVLLARYWLKVHHARTSGSDEIDETLLAVAERNGIPVTCTTCGTPGATFRANYSLGPACEPCASRRATWSCPECDHEIEGGADQAGTICPSCEAKPDWEALPEVIREEIGTMIDDDRWIDAIHRLNELDGARLPNTTYMRMVAYRRGLRRR